MASRCRPVVEMGLQWLEELWQRDADDPQCHIQRCQLPAELAARDE